MQSIVVGCVLVCCASMSSAQTPLSSAQTPFHRTYLGGAGADRVQGVAVDRLGRVYVTGHTDSPDFSTALPPAAGGFDKTGNGNLDAYVAVLSTDLQNVLYWTLIGGANGDRGYGVEVLKDGDVIVVGFTDSANFPTTNGSLNHGLWDVFVSRFSPDLKVLRASWVYGGSGDENPRGSFCVNAAGQVFVAGRATSLDLPTSPNAFQPAHAPVTGLNDWDGFVVKFSATGHRLWSTYLGGSENDGAYSGVRLASDGSVVVAGMTNSTDFPVTAGAFQTQYNGSSATLLPYTGDGFVTRLTPDGSGLIFSTYLGGSEGDAVAGNDALELDSADNIVVIGGTHSMNFPVTANAFDDRCEVFWNGQPDVFVCKLAANGSTLLASTFLGGEQHEEPSGLVLGVNGAVFISGNTESTNYPVSLNAKQLTYSGNIDAFITELSADLSHLTYSSYIGGHGQGGMGDRGRGLTLAPSGDLIVGGDTDSTDLPMSNYAFDDEYGGGSDDGFISLETLSTSYAFGVGKPNSIGLTPVLDLLSAPSLQAGSFSLQVSNAVPLHSGIFAFGNSLSAVPYHGGTLYMGQPLLRVGVIATDATGNASITLPVTPNLFGVTRIYQYWYRDPAHPDGTNTGLSNAFKVTYVY